MTLKEVLAMFGELEYWKLENEHNPYGDLFYLYEGEESEGFPSWRVEYVLDGFTVECHMGWYTQHGESESTEELVAVMKAMLAAYERFNEMMQSYKNCE